MSPRIRRYSRSSTPSGSLGHVARHPRDLLIADAPESKIPRTQEEQVSWMPAMSSGASGRRSVDPDTEEDFRCAG